MELEEEQDEYVHDTSRSQARRSRYIGCTLAIGYAVMFLLGACMGFAGFHAIFFEQFAQVLSDVEIRHNGTLRVLQDRLDIALEEKRACFEDDSQAVQIAEMRGTLHLHTMLKDQYEELIQNYDKLIEEREELEQRNFGSREREIQLETEIASQREQMNELRHETDLRARESEELRENIQRHLGELRETIAEIARLKDTIEVLDSEKFRMQNQVEHMQEHIRIFQPQFEECKVKEGQVQTQIQHRQQFLCKEEHGVGPYYVQFTVTPQDETETFSFVVELASRMYMPHSVYTFLAWVEYQLYDGTKMIGSNDHGVMVTTIPDSTLDTYMQKRRVLGMEGPALLFDEMSPQFPCIENSIGFSGLGPELEIYIPGSSNERKSCFGRIVHGVETLAPLFESISQGNGVQVVQVQHLIV